MQAAHTPTTLVKANQSTQTSWWNRTASNHRPWCTCTDTHRPSWQIRGQLPWARHTDALRPYPRIREQLPWSGQTNTHRVTQIQAELVHLADWQGKQRFIKRFPYYEGADQKTAWSKHWIHTCRRYNRETEITSTSQWTTSSDLDVMTMTSFKTSVTLDSAVQCTLTSWQLHNHLP